ncbi:hypothetical protein EUTSA_v10027060mg, partial [Eutrema salsugineum]
SPSSSSSSQSATYHESLRSRLWLFIFPDGFTSVRSRDLGIAIFESSCVFFTSFDYFVVANRST